MATHTPPHPPVPEIIARGLLVEAGRVLLCRNVAKGYFYLPGGHVDHGERASDALAREFREECSVGIVVRDAALVCELVTGSDDGGLHEYNVVFHVEREPAGNAEPVASLEPHIAFEWLDLAAVVDADLRPTPIKAWIASGGAVDAAQASFLSG
ncbi:MAG: NUDIX domain-containing protein [Planctomycetota bacterium]